LYIQQKETPSSLCQIIACKGSFESQNQFKHINCKMIHRVKHDLDFWSIRENKNYAEMSVLFTIDNPSFIKQKIFPNGITVYSSSHVQRVFVFGQTIL